MRGVAGVEQIALVGVADREVHVFTGAIDACERLLVQEAGHAVALGHLLQRGHHELLVIVGEVGLLKQWRDLELAGRDLVVTGLGQNALLEQLAVDLNHVGQHALGDGAKVVVVELLTLGRLGAKQRAARGHQVGAGVVEVAVDQEVFLLSPGVRDHRVNVVVTEQAQHAVGLLAHRLLGAQQGCLLVQRLTGPGDEDRGDAQRVPVRVFQDVGGAGHVPAGVPARLEGAADAAVGEGRTVGLALGERLPGKQRDGGTVAVGLQEGVVLLSGEAGKRVEHVGIVRGAIVDGPVAHRGGDGVGNAWVERGALLDRLHHGAVDGLGQAALHGRRPEHIATEQIAERLAELLHGRNVGRNCIDRLLA